MNLIWFLIIGGVAGWLAGLIMKGRGFGLLGNILVGVVGGIIGGYLLNWFSISSAGLVGSLFTALLGAIVLLAIAGLIRKA